MYKKFEQQPLVFPEYETIEGKPRLYVTPDGNFPSITSILSGIDKYDDGLDKWRKRVGEEEAHRQTKAASDRGNALHDYAEKYLLNDLHPREVKGAGGLLFNQARHLYNPIDVVYATECILYSKTLGCAGRTDALVSYNRIVSVLDHKNNKRTLDLTRTSYAKRKLFKYMLQCSGYSICYEDMMGDRLKQGVIIMSNFETHNSKPYVFDITKYWKDQFKLAVDIYHGEKDAKESDYYKL